MLEQVQQLVKDLSNGKEPIRGINPDETDAYGGTLQTTPQCVQERLHTQASCVCWVVLLGCFFASRFLSGPAWLAWRRWFYH